MITSFFVLYRCVHISLDEVFSKILKNHPWCRKKMIPHIKAKVVFIRKKNKKWPTKKRLIFKLHSQYFFAKISWTGLLVSRIDWCEGYWCGSTYMVVSSKTGKKWFFGVFLGCFWAYLRQPHDHIGWAVPMPFASINPIHPRTNLRNFHEKILRIGEALKMTFV